MTPSTEAFAPVMPGRTFPTVVHMLADAAERAGHAEALVAGKIRLSYAEYARCVAGFARELHALGAAGARVALLCGNSIEAAVASFAIQAAGAVFCPMNPAYTARELREALEDAGCRIAVCDGAAASVVRGLGLVEVVEVGADTATWLAAWREDWGQVLTGLMPDPDALGMIQYTGGTTGRSKGVMLRHRAVATNVAQREALLPTEPGDRFLCMMPLFHSFAMAMNLYQAAWCAGALIILPRYRPDWVVDMLVRERITVLPAGATVFIGLLGYDGFATTDFSALRICYSGASALPAETMRRWHETTGCAIYEGYGQTEAGPILTYNSPHFPAKPGKVGLPLPETEVQVVDAASGFCILPAGESGEIRARGPQLMDGYWNRPDETAEALRDGWLHTGDIGAFDADGHLAILDRKKDMLITGGYNVYPREVDEVLLQHPAVAEAATFGLADAYRGEVVASHVVLRGPASVQDLLEHCRDNLAKYKVPAVIRLVEAIPKTNVGKTDRKALRAAGGG
jgi:long-chain acyl-CoA synthetase